MKKLALAAACLGITVFATSAFAGGKWTYLVTIEDHGTFKTAQGSMGSARNSADADQYIGCQMFATASSSSMLCYARNVDGTYLSCSSSNENFKKAVAAMSHGSWIFFQTSEQASWQCASLQVNNGSHFEPPQP